MTSLPPGFSRAAIEASAAWSSSICSITSSAPTRSYWCVGHARELGQRRAHDRPAEPLLGDARARLVELERVDLAELAEHREVVAGAAADLEDPRARRRLRLAPDQGGEHLAARPVPPVPLVELGHVS